MHQERTEAEGLDVERCWNCGATPNVRCCEFGREPRDDLERTLAATAARRERIDRDVSKIDGAITLAIFFTSAAIVLVMLWMVLGALHVW